MIKKRLNSFLPMVFLAGILFFVFLPVLTGGAFLNTGVIYSDLWLFNYPLKDWYRGLLLDGQLPFWTSLVGNGYPVFAEGQIGALYPLHLLLFRILPTLLAFNFNLFFHFLLAAVFTYAFARITLRLSTVASLLSALVYSLSGFFVTHLHQVNIVMVVSYLPLMFLVIERLVSTRRVLWSFLLAAVIALSILAGHIEMFYYSGLLGLAWFGVLTFLLAGGEPLRRGERLRVVLLLGFAYLVGAGISAVQLLPTWEMTQYSQRSEGVTLEQAASTVWPLETLMLFVNPTAYDLYRSEPGYHPLTSQTVNIMALYGYVGILPLLLAIVALAVVRKRYVVVFGIFLLLAFVYGMGRSTQLFAILWESVPGLKFFRYPVKILFFIEFCLAVLSGFGLDAIREKLGRGRTLGRLAAGLLVLGVVFVDLYLNNFRRANLVVPGEAWLKTPESVEILRERLGDRNLYRVYSHGTNNLDYQMARRFEMQQQFTSILPVDFNMIYRIPMNREWFVLFLERQTRLNAGRTSLNFERGSLGLPADLKRSLALQGVRFLVADLPIEDADLTLVERLPFSQTVDHYAYLTGPQGVETVTVPAEGVYVYEFAVAVPRARFVSQVKSVREAEAALAAVVDSQFDAVSEVVLEEEVEMEPRVGGGKAEIIADREDELEVAVQGQGDGWLVLSDTYYPGWRAWVDGLETQILLANYAFRAVRVPAGEHRVVFRFEPTYWRQGLLISGVSLAITLLGLGLSLWRRG